MISLSQKREWYKKNLEISDRRVVHELTRDEELHFAHRCREDLIGVNIDKFHLYKFYGSVRPPVLKCDMEQNDLFLRWYAIHSACRELVFFKNNYEILEYSLSTGDENELYATDIIFKTIMDKYWSYIMTFMRSCYQPHIDENTFMKNEQPITTTEWKKIMVNSVDSNGGPSQMISLCPENAWSKFHAMDTHICDGPYYMGVKQNNSCSIITRIDGKWNCGINDLEKKKINKRKLRVHVHHLTYKMFSIGHGVTHKLLSLKHNTLLRNCKCPDNRVCINPRCYDIICQGYKRKRVEGLTDEEKIKILKRVHKEYPWMKNVADMKRLYYY